MTFRTEAEEWALERQSIGKKLSTSERMAQWFSRPDKRPDPDMFRWFSVEELMERRT